MLKDIGRQTSLPVWHPSTKTVWKCHGNPGAQTLASAKHPPLPCSDSHFISDFSYWHDMGSKRGSSGHHASAHILAQRRYGLG